MTPSTHWHADHVFLPPGRMSDLFLIRVIAPFLRDLDGARTWFFIRYGEGGPHLRVRVVTADETTGAIVHHHWQGGVSAFLDDTAPGPEWNGAAGPTFTPGTVRIVSYEAEIARYGGERAMPIGERLFCRSTTLALGIVDATLDDPNARIGQTMRLMMASASVLTDDPAAIGTLFRAYAEGWRNYLARSGWIPGDAPVSVVDPEAIRRALQPDARPTYGTAWRTCLREMLDELDEVGPLSASKSDIVMSQLHMLCNRLGVSPATEFHLATQIGGAL